MLFTVMVLPRSLTKYGGWLNSQQLLFGLQLSPSHRGSSKWKRKDGFSESWIFYCCLTEIVIANKARDWNIWRVTSVTWTLARLLYSWFTTPPQLWLSSCKGPQMLSHSSGCETEAMDICLREFCLTLCCKVFKGLWSSKCEGGYTSTDFFEAEFIITEY